MQNEEDWIFSKCRAKNNVVSFTLSVPTLYKQHHSAVNKSIKQKKWVW